jgi:hypothetical protein
MREGGFTAIAQSDAGTAPRDAGMGGKRGARSEGAAAGDELEDEDDDRDDEQEVNDVPADVHRESSDPEDDQDHDDQPQQVAHVFVPFVRRKAGCGFSSATCVPTGRGRCKSLRTRAIFFRQLW